MFQLRLFAGLALLAFAARHKHLKIYKSLFQIFITESKDIVSKLPTVGFVPASSKVRFGAYGAVKMVLAYTGARRGEIAKTEKSQIKFDKDSQRYHLLIAQGGQRKDEECCETGIRHPKLIERGLMEYVDRQWKDRIFSEVAGTNMTQIDKVFADLRDQLELCMWMTTENGGC